MAQVMLIGIGNSPDLGSYAMRFAVKTATAITTATLATLLYGCGDSREVGDPPPNLAGVWAGTWTGPWTGTSQGLVTGTWEAELSQTETNVSGTVTLRGDIDCMDGVLVGSATNNSVAGTVDRSPCALNRWT